MAIWVLLFIFFPCSTSSSYTTKPHAFPSLIHAANKAQKPYQQKYFTQILDHFNYGPQSYQTFQQRYLINDTYWGGPKNHSPIFVYTGNEGDIEWFAQNTGFMFDIAPRFKALLVFIEHRFYGRSIPYGASHAEIIRSNSSRLGYLSSTQALADYAALILDLKKNLSAGDSPVVVFGGSYGGVLAAWFRLKYSHVAIGALASSAPILGFYNITSPYIFNDIITRDFRKIMNTAAKRGGLEILRKTLKLCENNFDVDDIMDWLNSAYTYVAMADYPTMSDFIRPLPAYPIKEMCKAIDDSRIGNDTLKKLYGAINIYYNYTGRAECFNVLEDSNPRGTELWDWQVGRPSDRPSWRCYVFQDKASYKNLPTCEACTEMVLVTSGSRKDSIFPAYEFNYSAMVQYCKEAFNVTPMPTWVPTEFGGRDHYESLKRFGSNIIFYNGLRDPWSGGGVLHNISKSIIAIVAKQGAHHLDLKFATPEDPKWLQDTRKSEVQIISTWIAQYYSDLNGLVG